MAVHLTEHQVQSLLVHHVALSLGSVLHGQVAWLGPAIFPGWTQHACILHHLVELLGLQMPAVQPVAKLGVVHEYLFQLALDVVHVIPQELTGRLLVISEFLLVSI